MTEPIIWHYTIGDRVTAIFDSGVIRPATAFVPPDEKPIVWFSTNQVWEETACKMVTTPRGLRRLSKAETEERGNGLFRIGVAPHVAPMKWRELREKSGMAPNIARALEITGKKQGSNIGQWRGTFESVPVKEFIAVEIWQNNQWVSFAKKTEIPEVK